MDLHRAADHPCPANAIAVAINDKKNAQHCGIIFTHSAGGIRLCDMQWERMLAMREVPEDYFWVQVTLDQPEQAGQIAEYIELVYERAFERPLPYSFVYTYDGFDPTGRIRDGVGLTCATFIIDILDRLKISIVDLTTWKRRPKQDDRFRERIIGYAQAKGQTAVAARLMAERADFRLKPWELCGSVTHSRYPVRFTQAVKLSKTVDKIVRKKTLGK